MSDSQDKLIGLNAAEQILQSRAKGEKAGKTEETLHVDHVKANTNMGLFIGHLPMDPWIKKIMIMRIGSFILRKPPMSHLEIALQLGMTEEEVKELSKKVVAVFKGKCSAVTVLVLQTLRDLLMEKLDRMGFTESVDDDNLTELASSSNSPTN